MKKYLPFTIPSICGFGQFAIVLGILAASPSPSVAELFAQSYVQLIAVLPKYGILFDTEFGDNQFMNSPFLDKYIIPTSFFENCGMDVIQFSRAAISKDMYVGFLCDRYYFPFCKNAYQQNHYTHFALLTGFDDETQTFHIVDYFNQKYSSYDCPYDCLRDAATSEYCFSDSPFEDSILCVKKRDSTVYPIHFNIDRLAYLTQEYLKGYEDSQIMKGISVYKALSLFTEEHRLPYSAAQTIYDHKIAMYHRLKILGSLEYIHVTDDDQKFFEEVMNQALILRNTLVHQQILDGKHFEIALPKTLNRITQFELLDRKAMIRFQNMLLNAR